MMKSSEIRSTFINYYKKNNHTHVASSNLIPENDATLLFANSGMVQFKNLFLGLEKRDYTRAVSSQKCIRAGGKHNDLDNVGFTARHHTFFEMLGNFSFGDYFKKEAIHYAWDVLTNEYKIPKDKLYVTCHISDDEAADIWHKQEGVPKDRIFRFDKDNFWRMGDVGPCGPSTEIFYDHGAKAGLESDPYKGIAAGEDRYVEIWNQVFMQYDETSPGNLISLPKPSVDTGMGFERLVAALQGQFSNYDTELFVPLVNVASKISKLDYVTDPEILRSNKEIFDRVSAMRVLADHTRAVSFLLADGALPSNEGRGYVLRRIMRRAIRYGRKLSTENSFLTPMSEILIAQMSDFYPELSTRKNHILSTIKDEESRFLQTLDNGTAILHDEIKKLKSQNQKSVSGEILFKMYDTYGFPVDLTSLMAAESGLTADENFFEKIMLASKQKAKSTWKSKSLKSDEKHIIEFGQKYSAKYPTKFLGYDSLHADSKVLSLSNGSAETSELKTNESGFAILDQTTFYAESGGQVGDHGILTGKNFKALVHDCVKQGNSFLHQIEVTEGTLKINDTITSDVDNIERRQIVANHSATHLMHAALRKVLGTHVIQAGSLVDVTKTRFDFTHNKPVTTDEIKKIEDLVNTEISAAHAVTAVVMSHKKAIDSGAMALFGEKYGDEVRVLTMGDTATTAPAFSIELCGGTHVKNTAQIRAFKIMSESGVSAGVRRIEAIAGDAVIEYFMQNTNELKIARKIATLESDKSLSTWISDKILEIKFLQKEIQKIQSSQINVDEIFKSAKEFNSSTGPAKYIFVDLALDDREVLSQVSDQLKNKIQTGIVVVIGKGNATHPVIISVSKDLTTQFQAGVLLKDFALILGGKGGGRSDFAQGAVPDRTKIKEASDFLNQKILN